MNDSDQETLREWSVDGRVRLVRPDGSVDVERVSMNGVPAANPEAAEVEALAYYRASQLAKGVALAGLEWETKPIVTVFGWFDR